MNKLKHLTAYILIALIVISTIVGLLAIWDIIKIQEVFKKAITSVFLVFVSSVVILFIFSVLINNKKE
jgi:Mg2+/citrate symporter